MPHLLDLVPQDVPLRRVANTNDGEYAGPCPGCGGKDRFRVWPREGRYWCRGCGRRGDTIQYLRHFHGLSFAEAKRVLGLADTPCSHAERTEQEARKNTRAMVKEIYRVWCHEQMIFYTDLHRELLAEEEILQIALRHPRLYDQQQDELYRHQLVSVQEQLASIQTDLDVFTYNEFEDVRFFLFKNRRRADAR